MADCYGHSGNAGGCWEHLDEHLRRVSERAGEYAAVFGADDQARTAGLLHDLGKYADQFQERLKNPNHEPCDHWTAGAALLLMCYKRLGLMSAMAVQGHHRGLGVLEADWKEYFKSLAQVLCKPDVVTEKNLGNLGCLKERFECDGFSFPVVREGLRSLGHGADDMLDTRMLFSTLVDADFIETEAHFEGDCDSPYNYRPVGPPLEPAKALTVVTAAVEQLAAKAQAQSEVQAMRDRLFTNCLAAADGPAGIFTLSAPTGSGKTLAMLAFALRHAQRHGLRRIVLVMPFLNIIDQTARTYRDLFSDRPRFHENYVLEDHSLADAPQDKPVANDDGQEQGTLTRRLLAQNWDAPIILTTNVQCLESLMSNRPGACRKLHRLAGSVILFDEVQTLPVQLAVPTLATLGRLSARFGTSVVFATATQPAFDHLNNEVRKLSPTGWCPAEIVPQTDMVDMFRGASRRTRVRWEHDAPTPLKEIANAIGRENQLQVLCIVNLKRHATALFELLAKTGAPGLCHLSTNMCPAHRAATLKRIEIQLKDESSPPICLVSTQCVEAGVDLDFPVVYRALAPLEAIAQAAGRCNRHGRRPEGGTVHVFQPQDEQGIYPPGYENAAGVTKVFLNDLRAEHGDLDDIDIIQNPLRLGNYYRMLYKLTGAGSGTSKQEADLGKALDECSFEKVAKLYRLIDADTINVLVPYEPATFDGLCDEIRSGDRRKPGFLRDWIRRARPHSVGVYRKDLQGPIRGFLLSVFFGKRAGNDEDADWFVCLPDATYDENLGLRFPEEFPTCV